MGAGHPQAHAAALAELPAEVAYYDTTADQLYVRDRVTGVWGFFPQPTLHSVLRLPPG